MRMLPLFGMILGLGGLCNAWRIAHGLWGVPLWVCHALAILAFAAALACWALLIRELRSAKEGFVAATRVLLGEPSAALLFMTSLVLSLVLRPYFPGFAAGLFGAAALGQVLIGVECASSCWRGSRAADAITPALLMPTVGGFFLVSLCASTFVSVELGTLAFGAALVSWLVTESVVVLRLMNNPLPASARATLGVHVTPAAIACLACLSLEPDPDSLWARFLLGYALLQALVVLRIGQWLRVQTFSAAAWAYTFGISALCASTLRLAQRSPGSVVATLGVPLFIMANLLIGWIFWRTLDLGFKAFYSRRPHSDAAPLTR